MSLRLSQKWRKNGQGFLEEVKGVVRVENLDGLGDRLHFRESRLLPRVPLLRLRIAGPRGEHPLSGNDFLFFLLFLLLSGNR